MSIVIENLKDYLLNIIKMSKFANWFFSKVDCSEDILLSFQQL